MLGQRRLRLYALLARPLTLCAGPIERAPRACLFAGAVSALGQPFPARAARWTLKPLAAPKTSRGGAGPTRNPNVSVTPSQAA